MRTRFITAIYSDVFKTHMGGRSDRRDHYRYSLLSLLRMTNADFVCYTSDREIASLRHFFYEQHQIAPSQLEFRVYDLAQTPYAALIEDIRPKSSSPSRPDRCHEIQYAKLHWFHNEDQTYDYYYWIDAGLSHTGLLPDKYLIKTDGYSYRSYFDTWIFDNHFLENLHKKSDKRFLLIAKENVRNFWERTVPEDFYTRYDASVHIIGGLLGGHVSSWPRVVDAFDQYLRMVLACEHKLFYEEHILSLMYQNHKDWFTTLEFDIWLHEDNYLGDPKDLQTNKSFYKVLEELMGDEQKVKSQ